jgi:hypothetical protein
MCLLASLGVIGISCDWPVPPMSLSGPRNLTVTKSVRGNRVNQLQRVQNFNVSRDGFGAGEHQSIERPFGHADPGDMFAYRLKNRDLGRVPAATATDDN